MINISTKKILVSTIAVFVLVFLFDALYFSFVDDKALDVFELHKLFYGEYSQNHTAANLKEKLEDLNLKGQLISDAFLSEEEVVNFIDELENIGRNNNVVVEVKNVDASDLIDKETNKKKLYGDLAILMNVTGDWNFVYNFTKLIENLPYHSNIKSVNFTSSSVERETFWKAEISIDVITKTK
jgi:hypothetical protein